MARKRWLAAALIFAGAAPALWAQGLVRVPEDVPDLLTAVAIVADGGVVDLAPGVYVVKDGPLRIRQAHKSFTVRARVAGEVVFDGQGTSPILELPGSGEPGPTVTLEGLVFRNGRATAEAQGGGVRVVGRDVTLSDCVFSDNGSNAPSTGGGALRIDQGSRVRVEGGRFERNFARNRGGAIEIYFADLRIEDVVFLRNRVDRPGHIPRAVGGAIWALDSRVEIFGSRFEDNSAPYVGGAIYAFGNWEPQGLLATTLPRPSRVASPANAATPIASPGMTVVIHGSRFVGNVAWPSPGTAAPLRPAGGAIHIEDNANLFVERSDFEGNRANFGGAISLYRSHLELLDSRLVANRADTLERAPGAFFEAFGGAVMAIGTDLPDGSTGFGAIDRRSGSVSASRTLFQGPAGNEGGARHGGCLAVIGDTHRQFGLGGLPATPDLSRHRAAVELRDVVFDGCTARSGLSGLEPSAGAVSLALVDALIADSLLTNNRAVGGRGGAIRVHEASALRLVRSALADNRARHNGGAIHIAGGELVVENSAFLRNTLEEAGGGHPISQQSGSALFVSPATDLGLGVTGRVFRSLFAGDGAAPIFEGDGPSPPINSVVYNANTFVGSASRLVFYNPRGDTNGSTVAGLNAMVIQRNGGPATDKSEQPNQVVATASAGFLVAAPERISAARGRAGALPGFLGYAWLGQQASLDGAALGAGSGVVMIESAGARTLRVNDVIAGRATFGSARPPSPCDLDHCFANDRFLVEVTWRDFVGHVGRGEPAPLRTDHSGLFYFFQADNWELLTKVLDGCALNGHFWIFAAAATNVEYTLEVTDRENGRRRIYRNPLGRTAPTVADTLGMPCATAGLVSGGRDLGAARTGISGLETTVRDAAAVGSCAPGPRTLCLGDGRFRVEIDWVTAAGARGNGSVVPGGSVDSGIFTFFAPDNWEILVKVLDGCGVNGHFWVLAAATTDVGYTLTVTDTVTAERSTYRNQVGDPARAVLDAEALSGCNP